MGWHSFEQSLTKAYERNLITEETALLYSTNHGQMSQRLDKISKNRDFSSGTSSYLKMKGDFEDGNGNGTSPPISVLPGAKVGGKL